MVLNQDAEYLEIIESAIRTCSNYRPRFGHGRKEGLTLEEFQQLYRSDPLYSWLGLDNPRMYTAHRVAGAITSVYRQIGIGCQQLFNKVLKDCLQLDDKAVKWSYIVPNSNPPRKIFLDARIPIANVSNNTRNAIKSWLSESARYLGLPEETVSNLQGAVFEVRQGYKSKDSKRQHADVDNASNAYAHLYLPVLALFSTQIDLDVAERYRSARWLLLFGKTSGPSCESTYVFFRDVIGYDLAAFFQRNQSSLQATVDEVLRSLLNELEKQPESSVTNSFEESISTSEAPHI